MSTLSPTLDSLHSSLKLLSEPLRLRLCALLGRSELAVHELVSITGLQQSRVSNHLSLLKRAGVVKDRREGSWSFHSWVEPASDGPLSPSLFAATLEPYLESDEGASDLAALQVVLDRRREKSREAHDRLASQWQELGEEIQQYLFTKSQMLVPSGRTVLNTTEGMAYNLGEYQSPPRAPTRRSCRTSRATLRPRCGERHRPMPITSSRPMRSWTS